MASAGRRGSASVKGVRGVRSVYQVKITLRHSRPPIWRRVLVPGEVSLYALHQVAQIAMGWTDSHLHRFVIDGECYGIPSDEDFRRVIDERGVTLEGVTPRVPRAFDYEYDFGDGWAHEVLVERITPAVPGEVYPQCIKGRRACPPEDVGGIPGYEEFLHAIKDASHPEHATYLEWIGGGFGPEEFDLAATDRRLRSLIRAGPR